MTGQDELSTQLQVYIHVITVKSEVVPLKELSPLWKDGTVVNRCRSRMSMRGYNVKYGVTRREGGILRRLVLFGGRSESTKSEVVSWI